MSFEVIYLIEDNHLKMETSQELEKLSKLFNEFELEKRKFDSLKLDFERLKSEYKILSKKPVRAKHQAPFGFYTYF
ncbi:hypothetical protein [Mucilaginibacter antarcticus]